MSNIIPFNENKAKSESSQRQIRRSIRDLEVTIKSVEAALSLSESKQVRNSLNALKNAMYLLHRMAERNYKHFKQL